MASMPYAGMTEDEYSEDEYSEDEYSEECETCASRSAEEIPLHGYSSWLCGPCARRLAPYLFSSQP